MCKAKVRLIQDPHYVSFEIINMHDLTSHKEEGCKHMTLAQRTAVHHAIRNSPHLTPTAIRRNLKNLSPSKHVPASKLQSIRYAARKERNNLVQIQFKDLDIMVTDTHGSLSELCDAMFLTDLIGKHNSNNAEHHMGLHQAVCVAYELDGGIRNYNFNLI
jgi:hypothetical protein